MCDMPELYGIAMSCRNFLTWCPCSLYTVSCYVAPDQCGATSLVNRYCLNRSADPLYSTFGVDFKSKDVQISGYELPRGIHC
jgi:hypothetical protein